MSDIRSVCVYCGSSSGQNPAFSEAASALGAAFARNGIRLVYGGASIGIMGAAAKAVLEGGGEVVGVIPGFLSKNEVPLTSVTDLIVTHNMHQRKHLMFDKSDAFMVLPGGIGTLEEAIEMITWRQLGQHKKPIIIVNLDGYWDPLIGLLDHLIAQKFAREDVHSFYTVVSSVEEAVAAIGAS